MRAEPREKIRNGSGTDMLKTLLETMPASARIAPNRLRTDSRNGCERRRPGYVRDHEVSRFRAKSDGNNNISILTALVRLHRRVQRLGKLSDDGLQVCITSASRIERMQREIGLC
jgi:hypothetical protein